MKPRKRILFVDDDPFILRGLQRVFHTMRQEWDMEFVESGGEALAAMDERHFDVIVSDMRMPNMNGAELLARVMKLHPTTVRLILSGYADKELILKCVGSTHQFLAKPCDTESLKTTILRASNLEDSLNSERLRSLVCQMSRIPSIPDLYMRVVEATSKSNASMAEIGRLVGLDVGMTAQVLKLTNSAYFGLRHLVSSAEEAVSYLGIDTIKALVLSIHAFSQFECDESGSLDMRRLWAHSLQVAAIAKRIATLELQDRKAGDEAFTAGMLHDIGQLVMAVNLPSDYAKTMTMARSGMPITTAEREVFGVDHAEVGGYLVGLWGLPVPIVEAVTFHHFPSRAKESHFTALASVHAANTFEREDSQTAGGIQASALDADYLAAIGCGSKVDLWRDLQTTV